MVSLLRKLVNYGRKKFITLAPVLIFDVTFVQFVLKETKTVFY
jgi:hypothetical protein